MYDIRIGNDKDMINKDDEHPNPDTAKEYFRLRDTGWGVDRYSQLRRRKISSDN